MVSSRLYWLDIAKGIAILLMVIGHTSIPSVLSNFIWAFHMPLFFIASGWTTNWEKIDFIGFTKSKIRTLLVPFFVYSLVVLWMQIPQGWDDFNHWIRNGWGSYALWFIPVLFLASLFAKLIYGIKNRYVVLGCAFMFAGISGILSFYKLHLPWTLSSVPFATFLVVVGTELKRFSSIIVDSKLWYILILFFVTAGISNFWRLDLCFNSILPFLPLTIGAITGTLMIFMVSSWIDKHLKYVSIMLQKVGNETYLIVAFSQIIIILLNEYFSLNVVLKYSILLLTLVALKYIKDGVNKLAKVNIL
jgi:fucose 4-O-acetylase-like acetyltransferase